jgi:toxin FitB
VAYLLDTNIISEIRKRHPHPAVLEWWRSADAASLYLSALTMGEIRLGIERLRLRDPVRADSLDQWLSGLYSVYADRIVSVNAQIADEWARLNASHSLPVTDSLLGATAKSHGWILVTRNVKDLARCGVAVLNPFEQR